VLTHALIRKIEYIKYIHIHVYYKTHKKDPNIRSMSRSSRLKGGGGRPISAWEQFAYKTHIVSTFCAFAINDYGADTCLPRFRPPPRFSKFPDLPLLSRAVRMNLPDVTSQICAECECGLTQRAPVTIPWVIFQTHSRPFWRRHSLWLPPWRACINTVKAS